MGGCGGVNSQPSQAEPSRQAGGRTTGIGGWCGVVDNGQAQAQPHHACVCSACHWSWHAAEGRFGGEPRGGGEPGQVVGAVVQVKRQRAHAPGPIPGPSLALSLAATYLQPLLAEDELLAGHVGLTATQRRTPRGGGAEEGQGGQRGERGLHKVLCGRDQGCRGCAAATMTLGEPAIALLCARANCCSERNVASGGIHHAPVGRPTPAPPHTC